MHKKNATWLESLHTAALSALIWATPKTRQPSSTTCAQGKEKCGPATTTPCHCAHGITSLAVREYTTWEGRSLKSGTESAKSNCSSDSKSQSDSNSKPFNHYFKDVSKLEHIDVYRVLKLFGVIDPCLQHAIKKLLVAGKRGSKPIDTDVQEAIVSLQRFQQMRSEERGDK